MNATEARRQIDLAYGALDPPWTPESIKRARRRLISAKNALKDDAPTVALKKPVLGAIVVNAGNANVDLLRQAGVSHVCVELNAANEQDFLTNRWNGFNAKGWFLVSRGNDGDTLAARLDEAEHLMGFAVVDTESHKADMGGSLAWTETLYAALRSKLGPAFPLFNITFGIHSSSAVVNHEAFRRHNVTPIWEAYDGDGRTLGVAPTSNKAALEGWQRPHIAIGDKSIPEDAPTVKANAPIYGGIWLWAPEQAGIDVLALRGVV